MTIKIMGFTLVLILGSPRVWANPGDLVDFLTAKTAPCALALTTVDPHLDLDRLTLRRARNADRSAIYAILNDQDVARCYLLESGPSRDGAAAYYSCMREAFLTPHFSMLGQVRIFVFAIESRERRQVVGLGMIQSAPDHADAWEIGYAMSPKHRGRGYATEVVRGLRDFIAGVDPRAVIEASPLNTNFASHAVLARAGFVEVSEYYVDHPDRVIWRWTAPKADTRTADAL